MMVQLMALWNGLRYSVGQIVGLRMPRFNNDGATTAEYALLLALVVVILITTLSQLGAELNAKLLEIIDQLREAG